MKMYEIKQPLTEFEKNILEDVSEFVGIPVHKIISVLLMPFYAACTLKDKDDAARMKYENYMQFLQDFKKDFDSEGDRG